MSESNNHLRFALEGSGRTKRANSRERRLAAMPIISILMLDIDDYRLGKNTNCYVTNTELLECLGVLIETCIRDTDTPARFDSSAFAVLLPKTSAEGAKVVGERIRAAVEANTGVYGRVTLSIGIATRRRATHDEATLMQKARQALQYSKLGGGNCVTHIEEVKSAA